jgi:hypothetical protein
LGSAEPDHPVTGNRSNVWRHWVSRLNKPWVYAILFKAGSETLRKIAALPGAFCWVDWPCVVLDWDQAGHATATIAATTTR